MSDRRRTVAHQFGCLLYLVYFGLPVLYFGVYENNVKGWMMTPAERAVVDWRGGVVALHLLNQQLESGELEKETGVYDRALHKRKLHEMYLENQRREAQLLADPETRAAYEGWRRDAESPAQGWWLVGWLLYLFGIPITSHWLERWKR